MYTYYKILCPHCMEHWMNIKVDEANRVYDVSERKCYRCHTWMVISIQDAQRAFELQVNSALTEITPEEWDQEGISDY